MTDNLPFFNIILIKIFFIGKIELLRRKLLKKFDKLPYLFGNNFKNKPE